MVTGSSHWPFQKTLWILLFIYCPMTGLHFLFGLLWFIIDMEIKVLLCCILALILSLLFYNDVIYFLTITNGATWRVLASSTCFLLPSRFSSAVTQFLTPVTAVLSPVTPCKHFSFSLPLLLVTFWPYNWNNRKCL